MEKRIMKSSEQNDVATALRIEPYKVAQAVRDLEKVGIKLVGPDGKELTWLW